MGNVKIESLLFSRYSPLSAKGDTLPCPEPCAACQMPVIVTLFNFFSFPAENESAGCVLLHTSRKVRRDSRR